ncbi:hypothetical protein PENTCL1PPCAC_17751, partial [Pristionchus entomophagus]
PQMEVIIPVVGRESISSSSSVRREEEREDYSSPINIKKTSDESLKSSSSSSLLGMFGGKKGGGFGFGGLGKLAGDAIGKAKAASEQLQKVAVNAVNETTKSSSQSRIPSTQKSVQPSPLTSMAASPIGVHPGLPGMDMVDELEGLSEEERMKIMAVMACAQLDAHTITPSTSSVVPPQSFVPPQEPVPIPPGLENLSEEERQKIMAVMANAAIDEQFQPPVDMMKIPSPSLPLPSFSSPFVPSHPSTSSTFSPSIQQTSPIPVHSPIPPGMEDLPEEEREKIMRVMAFAELDAGLGPSTGPSLPPLAPIPPASSSLQPSLSPFTGLSPISDNRRDLPSPIDMDLSGLSESEKAQIMSVMQMSEMEGGSALPFPPPVNPLDRSFEDQFVPSASYFREERDQSNEMRVEEGERQPHGYEDDERWYDEEEPQSVIQPQSSYDKYVEMEASSSYSQPQYPSESLNQSEEVNGESSSTPFKIAPSFDSSSSLTRESGYGTTSTSVDKDLALSQYQQPIGISSEEEEERQRELNEIRERERWLEEERKREEREKEEEDEKERRWREMQQVEEEQRRERERLRLEENKRKEEEERDDDVLIDSTEVRDGAESRTDGCSTDDDAFAFSETPRFNLPEGIEDWQQGRDQEWNGDNKPRMWTTVFESDDSEHPSLEKNDVFPLPPSGSVASQSRDSQARGAPVVYRNRYSSSTRDENSPVDAIEMDEVYDNFSIADAPSTSMGRKMPSTVSGGFRFDRGQEIEFDSTPRSLPSSSSLHRGSIPEISVTNHETLESDEEESGGEHTSDDEDYPDKVIVAPVAPPISYEEVEREREVQEAAATDMLQQIQALGEEAANDEFDVQWAHSQLKNTTKTESVITTSSSSIPSAFPSTESDPIVSSRKNPFLEEDDVKVDMEELNTDYSQAAAYYAGMGSGGLINHRPGPVYTITEEDEGERVVDGDAKTIAREKARRTAAAATQAILSFYEQQEKEVKKKERTTTTGNVIPPTTSSITSIPRLDTKTTMATRTTPSVIGMGSSIVTKTPGDPNYTQFDLPSFSVVSSASSTVTIPPASFTSTMEEVSKDLPARIIDPALQMSAVAEPTDVIDHSDRLFNSVYRSETTGGKPNLLFYDDSSFITLANDVHGPSTSPSFLIPNSGDQSSDESPSTPSKLKRSPAMIMPSERKIIDPIDPTITTMTTTDEFSRFPLPPKEKILPSTTTSTNDPSPIPISTSILKHISTDTTQVEATAVTSAVDGKFTACADGELSILASSSADPSSISTSAPEPNQSHSSPIRRSSTIG